MSFAFPRKKRKKGADLIHHFNFRCMERIGIILSQEDLKRRMNNHTLECIRKDSNTRTLFLVPKDMLPKGHTREMAVVYDRVRHNFVTVLFNDGGCFYDTDSLD